MSDVLLTEARPVGKRKNGKGKQPSPEPPFGRIELQADPEWIALLDEAAGALGVSRSAYIRMACNRQMAMDKKHREGDE